MPWPAPSVSQSVERYDIEDNWSEHDDDIARSERQILSIVTGDAARTAELRDFCVARGVFGSVFLPPFALDGRSFVRFTVHCGMNDAQCDRFLEVMEAARYIMK